TLSGTVTAGGTPLDGATVHVVTAAGGYITNTTTAGGGIYSLTLSPGTYKLYVQPNTAGYANQWFGGADIGSATVIAVSANTVQNIALVAGP
ncbi:MAG: carboxypeptidase-like regulatory domain-containing protein, partial [Candidatus Limnocylindrales bacterium]